MKPTKIGFTGTRHGMTEAQADMFAQLVRLAEFHRDWGEFRHGSCQGADVEAARIVRNRLGAAVRIICHPGPVGDKHQQDSGVDDETLAPKNHFARNRDIVDSSDGLIACPCDMTEQDRGGTWYTIRYARKVGKRVTIIWPDGSTGS